MREERVESRPQEKRETTRIALHVPLLSTLSALLRYCGIAAMGQVALESTSPGLQPGAGTAAMSGGPSQLPTH